WVIGLQIDVLLNSGGWSLHSLKSWSLRYSRGSSLPSSRAGWYLITSKLVLNGLAVVWLYADAKSRGWHADRIGLYVSIAAILIELVMPVYLIRSRGWRGALITVLRFCLYLLAFAVMLTAVGYIIGGPAIN
ncbi:hypothetical protein T5B8_09231, partial [Salinisphaera sp. T5B8]|uniref:hypothetical protein n=1 Tax=Salinisphaera sp. T5B8 TaxID=1304154 RepID=UPI00334263B4